MKIPKPRGRYPEAYHAAMLMQRVLLGLVMDDKNTPKDRATCAGAFVNLEDMKRKIRMVPNPKAIDVRQLIGKHAKQISFQEPVELTAVEEVPANSCSNGQEHQQAIDGDVQGTT